MKELYSFLGSSEGFFTVFISCVVLIGLYEYIKSLIKKRHWYLS